MKVLHAARLGFISLLSGCGAIGAVNPAVDNVEVIASVLACEAPPPGFISPPGYMELGFTKIDIACRAMFDKLTMLTQETRISRTALASGNLAALGVLSATSASVKAVTITSLGVTLVDQIIQQFAATYAYSPYLYKIQELIQNSMADYKFKSRTAIATDALMAGQRGDAYCRAYTYIVDYASLCTLSALQQRFDQQIALVSRTDTPITGTSQGGMRPAAQLFGAPRQTVIGGPPPTNYTVRSP